MGAVAHGTSIFPDFFLVSLAICLQAGINFQDLCASLLGDISLLIMLLTFISCFVIDFLSYNFLRDLYR